MSWSASQADALGAVFAALDAAGLPWMVLRNYEGLPSENRSKDVDLLLSREDFARAQVTIDSALRGRGFRHVERLRLQYVWCSTYWNVSSGVDEPIKLDLLDGFAWRGAQVVAFDDVWRTRVRYGSFFVPSPVHDGFMLWVKPLMTGGFVKERYRADILRTATEFPSEFEALVCGAAGERLGKKIWQLLGAGRVDETIPLKRPLCRAVWARALRRSPLRTVASTFLHFAHEVLRRRKKPPGSMIAVVGPDGSGKSTFIDHLRRDLATCLVKDAESVQVVHFRPNVFPNLKKLLGGSSYDVSTENFTSPHRARPAGRVSSLLRLTYYWSDYVLGFWLRIRRRCIAGDVFLFDRYFYDFLADPARSRIALPYIVRRAFLWLTPEPDLVYFLDCDAATIFGRKKELPLAEIERQLGEYRALARRSSRFVTLDGRKPPADSSREAAVRLVRSSFQSL